MCPESEFYEFEPRLKSVKSRFQLSAGLNLETLKKWTNHIWAADKFFKFGLSIAWTKWFM